MSDAWHGFATIEAKCASIEFRRPYSTDASVYQIEPLGVVVPRSRADIVATVRAARDYGASRHGRWHVVQYRPSAGIQLDTSKCFNRVLELNTRSVAPVSSRRARRVEPDPPAAWSR
jgi:FAD/FMN-containing dehydrogenase